jgi:3-oxoacyl-[acyl-carrier-protein] synthase II
LVLDYAGCDINDLAFINLHGSGTKKGDRAELKSIVEVLGNKKTELPICGLKPYTGHIGAASDIAEIIIGVKAVANGIIPGTLNFNKAEKEFSKLRISNAHQRCEKKYFLSVSYGIGGQSTSVIVKAA